MYGCAEAAREELDWHGPGRGGQGGAVLDKSGGGSPSSVPRASALAAPRLRVPDPNAPSHIQGLLLPFIAPRSPALVDIMSRTTFLAFDFGV
eukprot:3855209-Rhodomonas_salina.2